VYFWWVTSGVAGALLLLLGLREPGLPNMEARNNVLVLSSSGRQLLNSVKICIRRSTLVFLSTISFSND
jgi:hypothetical protein